jgi:threonine dehydrogenase-like Zn-dependent dehydrogenase
LRLQPSFPSLSSGVVLVGGPRTWKTHLATAIGVQAIEHRRKRVRFFSTVELVNVLEQEKPQGKPGQIAMRLTHSDLVILDELGYQPLSGAIQCARPGSMIGYVGVPHGVQFDGQQLFFSQIGMFGGPAPVRRFLPHLMDLVLESKINPGKVFDLELPPAEVAEGYRAMDERRAIKTLLRV